MANTILNIAVGFSQRNKVHSIIGLWHHREHGSKTSKVWKLEPGVFFTWACEIAYRHSLSPHLCHPLRGEVFWG